MRFSIYLACVVPALVGSCATPRQYVYNCMSFAITFDGKAIEPRTFESRSGALGKQTAAQATYPDGSSHPPLRVKSSNVDSFAYNNAWISPANICRQFQSQVVIVDLR